MCLRMLSTGPGPRAIVSPQKKIPAIHFHKANMKCSLAVFALGAVLRSAYAQNAPPASYGEAFPDGLSVLNPNGLNNIPSPGYTLDRWAWGTIPQACYDVANGNVSHLAPVDVKPSAYPILSGQKGYLHDK